MKRFLLISVQSILLGIFLSFTGCQKAQKQKDKVDYSEKEIRFKNKLQTISKLIEEIVESCPEKEQKAVIYDEQLKWLKKTAILVEKAENNNFSGDELDKALDKRINALQEHLKLYKSAD